MVARGDLGVEVPFTELPAIQKYLIEKCRMLGMRVITAEQCEKQPMTKGCFGWSGAYGTHFWIDPVNKLFAVYMKNSRIDGGAGNESALKFEQAVYTAF